MINYKLNKEKGILETKLTGIVSVKELSDYILKIGKDKKLPEKLKILSDASDAEFSPETTPEDLIKIVDANNKTLSTKEVVYDAYIVSKPFETAMGQLYKKFSETDNYFFNVFSTKEAAEEWLNEF